MNNKNKISIKPKIENGDYNSISVNRNNIQNKQNNIDKSKIINKNYTTIENKTPTAFFNPYNKDAIPYTRLKNINDRPMLKKYFNALENKRIDESYPIEFYAFVANELKYKDRYVLTNVVDEFGNLVATHINVFDVDLSKYIHQIIHFGGIIYKYNEHEDEDLCNDINESPDRYNQKHETKYAIDVQLSNFWKIKVIEPTGEYFDKPIWRKLYNNEKINIWELIDDYNNLSDELKLELVENSKYYLNEISHKLFGVPNMIYPTIISMFLMRDDVEDKRILIGNSLHINKLCSLVISYIMAVKPNNYYDLYKLLAYVVLTTMGYEINNPVKYGKDRIFAVTDSMGITRKNVKYYINNIKNNCGGVNKISDVIPGYLKYNSDNLNILGMQEFALRIKYWC